MMSSRPLFTSRSIAGARLGGMARPLTGLTWGMKPRFCVRSTTLLGGRLDLLVPQRELGKRKFERIPGVKYVLSGLVSFVRWSDKGEVPLARRDGSCA